MAPQAHYDKMELRKNYRNFWHADLMQTMQADTPYCCFAALCPPCASYMLRKRALYNDMSRYVCCAGSFPCSGKCGESRCPEICLCAEVSICFANSVASTRFMLQDEFNIQTTQCDNCIIGFMFCINQLACIFHIVAVIADSEEISEASELLSCLAELVYCTVCACMLTQHKIEMDKRDGVFGPQVMVVPPIQQMSRIDQPIPPKVGYTPQPAYGQPYGYPHAPQAQGYPHAPQAQGYPPSGYASAGYPQAGYPSTGYPPASYPQTGHLPAGYPPAGHPPAGYPPDSHPSNGYPPAGHQPAGYPPAGHPPAGYPPDSHPSDGYPPASHQPAGYPPAGHQPAGYPPADHPPAGNPSK